jgi:hypothetical protein
MIFYIGLKEDDNNKCAMNQLHETMSHPSCTATMREIPRGELVQHTQMSGGGL